eukprot:162500-Pyramimonas_sp.AAC.1
MSAKIGRYAKAAKRYRVTSRLEAQGAQAAGSYGFQIYGTFGQRLQQARRRAGYACGAATRGRCLTSLLELRMPGQDPGIKFPSQCVLMWLENWRDHPDLRAGICR